MSAIQSYKQHRIQQEYDVIIIGSGIGGLTSAAILAKEGQKVLVLEKHYTAGGFSHVFKRRGYEWDVGIHYIGEVHRPKTEISVWFDYISDGALKWQELGEIYDKIIFGKKVYNFVKGKENFINQLKEYFPEKADHEAIDKYVELVYQVQKDARLYYAEKAMPKVASLLAGNQMKKKFLKHASRTTLEVLESLTSNKKLIAVLTGQYGDYGLPPSKSSFGMHAAVVKHYINGGSFPIGGSSTIADSVSEVIHRHGGLVLTNADVKEIVVKKNKATGVLMADGKVIEAKTIISSAGVLNTYTRLLPMEVMEKHGLTTFKKLKPLRPSASHLCLYLGFNHTVEELGLESPNMWVYPDCYDHDKNLEEYLANPLEADFPVFYISFPACKDPDWKNRYPGKSTIDIITLAPYELFEEWEDERWKKRGEKYDNLKEAFTQRLLKKLFEYLPQLEGKVDHCELSSPLTTRHFVNYTKGEIYGLDHSPERFSADILRPHTPIKNLYLTGQDILSAGVGGALASGILTTSAMYKKDLSTKIRKRVMARREREAKELQS